MEHYDYIIAGGGAAGLSLAYHLQLSPLRNRRILIIDKDDDDQLQRNWGFWSRRPTLFDRIAHHEWDQVDVISYSGRHRMALGDYHYKIMHGAQFYRTTLEQLASCNAVTLLRGVVHQIEDGPDEAQVVVDDLPYAGQYVFDSIIRPAELKTLIQGHTLLRMQFKGWEIEVPALAFDPRAACIFDLRTPQQRALRFVYLMPYTETHAFVEYTVFASEIVKQEEHEHALRTYLSDVLGINEFTILSEENGAVPVTDYPFPRQTSRHVLSIGAKGGRIKPSTGYSFLRVQQDSEAIIRSLLRNGHPFDLPPDTGIFRLCDMLMLQVLSRHGELAAPIFETLFRRNPVQRIFRFLDEEASAWDILCLMASLPPWPFLQALWNRTIASHP